MKVLCWPFFPEQLQLIFCCCLFFPLLFYLLTAHKLDHFSSFLPHLCCWVNCSRLASLDYHCLLALWMEVSTYVTTSGLAEQTRYSKESRFMAFSAPKGPPSFLTITVWSNSLRSLYGLLMSNCMLHQTVTKEIQHFGVLMENVNKASCCVFTPLSDISNVKWSGLCLKLLFHLFWCCECGKSSTIMYIWTCKMFL